MSGRFLIKLLYPQLLTQIRLRYKFTAIVMHHRRLINSHILSVIARDLTIADFARGFNNRPVQRVIYAIYHPEETRASDILKIR